jgi:hypothetical protein
VNKIIPIDIIFRLYSMGIWKLVRCPKPLILALLVITVAAQSEVSFNYTGDYQTYLVPEGAAVIEVDAYGAQGGITYEPNTGGFGGRMRCRVPVTPGQTLYVFVGGAGAPGPTANSSGITPGGFNGGGSCDVYPLSNVGCHAGSGGGASDIRTSLTDLNSRLVVAGGGGGSVNCYSGVGGSGGPTGGDGTSNLGLGGRGATVSAGGAGRNSGGSGSFGLGGMGGWGTCLNSYNCGGGAGGGGYYGGGGDGGGPRYTAGGGGGSSYCHASGSVLENYAEARTGDGQITISITNCSTNCALTSSGCICQNGLPSGRPTSQPTYPALLTTHPSSTPSLRPEANNLATSVIPSSAPSAVFGYAVSLYYGNFDTSCSNQVVSLDGTCMHV